MGLRLRGARLGTPFMMPLPPPVGARERMLVSALLACAAFNPAVDLVSKRLCRHAWRSTRARRRPPPTSTCTCPWSGHPSRKRPADGGVHGAGVRRGPSVAGRRLGPTSRGAAHRRPARPLARAAGRFLGHDRWMGDSADAAWGVLKSSGWQDALDEGGPMLDGRGRVRPKWATAFRDAVNRLADGEATRDPRATPTAGRPGCASRWRSLTR